MQILKEKDVTEDQLKEKTITIIGYGNQGRAQALCFKDKGIRVIIGARPSYSAQSSWQKAQQEGFSVKPIDKAAVEGDIIHLLIPDENQADVYYKYINKHMQEGKTLCFSSGFNIVYNRILPPQHIDVIMVAPKSPGTELRKTFIQGGGVPGLIAVKQDYSRKAQTTALALAHALGLTRIGVLNCTFEQETYEDLFGEQNVLCGGCVDLIRYGFEVLVEAGYPPEMAYFEVLHELKLIVDLIQTRGLAGMNSAISNTAEWGEYINGPKIIDKNVKTRMKTSLKAIENGTFARQWIKEYKKGCANLKARRRALKKHPIEQVGKRIRAMLNTR